jgi:hypothetical protein
MEPVVATGGNRSQMERAQKPPNQAKTLAVGCDQLRLPAQWKEGSTVRVRQRAFRGRRSTELCSLSAS